MSGLAALLAAAAVAAQAAPAPAPPGAPPAKEVSPLLVTPQPGRPPPADVTVEVGGDDSRLRSQDISIWPAAARAAGRGGKVVLTCQVDVHGLAEICRVAYEEPQGQGFGAAALALRPTFKLAPRQGPDGPVAGPLNVAIDFRAPQLDTNIGDVMRARPPNDIHADGLNASALRIAENPIAMRRMTMMTEPAWAAAPSFAQWTAAYPAQGGGVEGYAVVHCRVQADGALARCATAKELPVGHGFGKAAVALAPLFRASPQSLAAAPRGAPIEVDVPIRFPPSAERQDRTVRAPIWLAGADPATLTRELPHDPAGRPAKPGPVLQCEVAADGRLAGCGVELTSPNGPAYDEAAMQLAARMRMSLWSAEASPVLGGVVHLPFGLAADGDQAGR